MSEQFQEYKRAAEAALAPVKQWHQRCHEASIALVQSGVIKGASVARGTCSAVGGQHSWVVLGDPYLPDTVIIDPTLWSYTKIAPEVYVGLRHKWKHRPKGAGSIFEWGRPPPATKPYKLKPPKGGWSPAARSFLDLLGPIDLEGWRVLAHAPVQGWPATEILAAMDADPAISAYIPIDIKGMVLRQGPDLYPRS